MSDYEILERTNFRKAVRQLASQNSTRDEFQISRWQVSKNSVDYYSDQYHTLSLYIRGGENSYRADQKEVRGGAGKICLMPKAFQSSWCINDEIDFLHLYLPDEFLRKKIALNFDMDVRHFELREQLYASDARLQFLLQSLFLNLQDEALSCQLRREGWVLEIVNILIENYAASNFQANSIRGGLTPRQIKNARQFMTENLEASLSLEQIASEVNLSAFHFQRMFKLSVGISPANFLTLMRLEKAKRLLKTSLSLVEISTICGFSHQSHMSSVFKRCVGTTPKNYRLNA